MYLKQLSQKILFDTYENTIFKVLEETVTPNLHQHLNLLR